MIAQVEEERTTMQNESAAGPTICLAPLAGGGQLTNLPMPVASPEEISILIASFPNLSPLGLQRKVEPEMEPAPAPAMENTPAPSQRQSLSNSMSMGMRPPSRSR